MNTKHVNRLTTFLSLSLLVQCLSLLNISRFNSSLGTYLFMQWRFSEATSQLIDSGGAILVSLVALDIFIRSLTRKREQLVRPAIAFVVFVGFWFFVIAATHLLNGGHFASSFSLFSHAARFLLPLVILGLFLKREWAAPLIAWAIAITFFAHGIEAILVHPAFVDYIVLGFKSILGVSLSENSAALLLRCVGLVDILCALAVLPLRARGGLFPRIASGVLLWMAFWGIFTASLRLLGFGVQNWAEFGIRCSHFALPLALYYYRRDDLARSGQLKHARPSGPFSFLKRKT